MLSKEELIGLSEIDLNTLNFEDLKELTEIQIDIKQPINQRINNFLEKISNPYIFKVNGTVVKISYCNHRTLVIDDCLKIYLKDVKNSEIML